MLEIIGKAALYSVDIERQQKKSMLVRLQLQYTVYWKAVYCPFGHTIMG